MIMFQQYKFILYQIINYDRYDILVVLTEVNQYIIYDNFQLNNNIKYYIFSA